MAYVPSLRARNRMGWPASIMDRFWDDMFTDGALNLVDSDWLPRADVHQVGSTYVVEIDLPGMEKKDVKVTYADGVLTVSGERKSESRTDDDQYHRVERSYGSFCRSFRLPKGADSSRIDATVKNGVLKVTVPMTKQTKPEEITVDVR